MLEFAYLFCAFVKSALRHVATCWVLFAQVCRFEPTTPNMSQQVYETHAACYTQQFCDVLC